MNALNGTQQAKDTCIFIPDRLHELFQDIDVLAEEQKNAPYALRGRRVIFRVDDVDFKSYFKAAETWKGLLP